VCISVAKWCVYHSKMVCRNRWTRKSGVGCEGGVGCESGVGRHYHDSSDKLSNRLDRINYQPQACVGPGLRLIA
jgi:hypothetical protein